MCGQSHIALSFQFMLCRHRWNWRKTGRACLSLARNHALGLHRGRISGPGMYRIITFFLSLTSTVLI